MMISIFSCLALVGWLSGVSALFLLDCHLAIVDVVSGRCSFHC